MPAIVVIGGQWGDEGKGRIVDLMARNASVVARYSAGNNAGHTIINDMGLFALHLVPAGVFYGDKTCLLGNGMAIDPAELIRELEMLESRGVSTDKVFKSKVMDSDEKYSFTFATAGTYAYFCSIHPKMTGKVIVQ